MVVPDGVAAGIVTEVTAVTTLRPAPRRLGANSPAPEIRRAPGAEAEKIEVKYERIFEHGPDALIVVDAEGFIHLVNRQTESLFGYARHELVGMRVDMLVADRARSVHRGHRAAYLASPTARAMDLALEPMGRRKDGTEFPVGVSLSPVETNRGIFLAAAVRDLTERQRIERERAQVEARLLVVERDEERAMMEAQLQKAQRLESIGQLAGGVAHDFNNLLAGIMNYAGLVSANLGREMDRRGLSEDEVFVTLVQDVGEITGVAKRAAALTHQLLTFSRRTVVRPEVLDLNSVVSDMEKLLRTTIGESVDLRMVFASELPLIKADRGQIDQVLMNLAVNARDAMPGGGKLEIETCTFEVDQHYARIHAIDAGVYVRLLVSDTGTGMSQEVSARSFEPFFSTKGEGSGLGLATVYGIVTQAGGNIVIDSELGSGTTVQVNFPATKDPVSGQRELPPDAQLSSRGETVLLVEDEEIVREPARRMLAMRGYTVLAAANADAALAIMSAHPAQIDLLLTDVVMPGGSGQELSIEVLEHRPTTKVLFMSGYSHDVIAPQGVLEEGVNLIEKPFSSDELLRKVRDVLDAGS
jgi:PAS domain S-box-containing protein